MSGKKVGLICVVSVVLLAAAVALAAAVKVELLPCPAENPIEPNASGHAILNYAQGRDKTMVEINCWGLKADMNYTAHLKAPEGFHSIGMFTTRKNGSGNLNVDLEGDHSAHLPVAINNDANETVLRSR
ncbi:MAG TPA: hypothetical protein VMW16_14545 [Sedimentisphaerales bacterium]|nr:hypothetical protein [Sedimentisphaerales bacterium]